MDGARAACRSALMSTAAACRRVEAQSASSSPPACFWTVDMAMALPRALTSTVTSRALVSV